MSGPFWPIAGIPTPAGAAIPKRRDIDIWYAERTKNPQTALEVSLFIQAMAQWYKQDIKDQLSYFRIAAIHGQPYPVTWDQATKDDTGVYCTHGEPTFPTFHRTYLTLYEQVLYNNMISIIDGAGFKGDKVAWKKAAQNWRLSFWDWTTEKFPAIASTKTIVIIDPATGKEGDPITNPMYSYQIQQAATMGDRTLGQYAIQPINAGSVKQPVWLPFDKAKGTSRFVSTQDGSDADWIAGTSNVKPIQAWLQQAKDIQPKFAGTLSESVSRLLSPGYFSSWELFATTKYYGNQKQWQTSSEWLSLEQIHNYIHVATGGGNKRSGLGHMSQVPVAAFDPIFWHHHCFIDLLFALWQRKDSNKNKWFDRPYTGNGIPNDPNDDPDPLPTDWLVPFHKAKTGTSAATQYNSNDVRYIEKLFYGYDYKGFETTTTPVNSQIQRQQLSRVVNANFSRTRSEVLDAVKNNPEIKVSPDKDNDLIINIIYNRYGLNGGGAYKIHAFVGPVDESIPYTDNPNRVGTIYTFSSPIETTGCQNCKEQANAKVLHAGQIPITGAVIKDAINTAIPDFNLFVKDQIEDYLKKNLSWRVSTDTGVNVPIEQLPDLKVFTLLGTGKHDEDHSVLSTYGDYEILYGATAGKVGGASPPA